ncbi:MAG: fibronectin type III domain-containing protein, partial [Planctomycetaceae bacterium]|nr:fibronectin type III domain-containing protein [Planctomycetaceae bacterium]
ITGTSYTVNNLLANTRYHFRVTAIASNGAKSTPSLVVGVTTPDGLPRPVIDEVNTKAVSSSSVIVKWNPVQGASKYTLEWKLASDNGTNPKWTAIDNITGTSYTVNNLLANTRYHFRVTAVASNGTKSTPSLVAGVTTLPLSNDDQYENNDTFATAYNLGSAAKTISAKSVVTNGVVDEDYFKFTLNSTGSANSYIKINFTHSISDLDLVLYNSAGTQLASSSGVGNEERISLAGLSAGTYTVWVKNYGKKTNDYTLTFQP